MRRKGAPFAVICACVWNMGWYSRAADLVYHGAGALTKCTASGFPGQNVHVHSLETSRSGCASCIVLSVAKVSYYYPIYLA